MALAPLVESHLSLYIRNGGGEKRERLSFFIAQTGRYIYRIGASSDVSSLQVQVQVEAQYRESILLGIDGYNWLKKFYGVGDLP
jgi:hypothetical protein